MYIHIPVVCVLYFVSYCNLEIEIYICFRFYDIQQFESYDQILQSQNFWDNFVMKCREIDNVMESSFKKVQRF